MPDIDLTQIEISFDETHHLYQGKRLYQKTFNKIMSFHPPGLAAVEDSSGAYHIDYEGEPVYEHNFRKTFGYYEGLAAVEDESGWYHIDTVGNPVYKNRFKWVGNYQEERCPIRNSEGLYFHINKMGEPVYATKFRYVGDFKYGIAVVYTFGGFARHIDKNGKFIHNEKFLELGVYHKGFAIARDEHGYFHVAKRGNQLYAERYADVEPFYNGLALIRTKEGELQIIDETGNVINKVLDETTITVQESLRNNLQKLFVGYWDTQIINVIARLGILDCIQNGCNTFNELKTKIAVPENSLQMIIRMMRVWNLIRIKENKYEITNKGLLLTEDHVKSLKYAAMMWADEHYKTMGALLDAIKTYKPQFETIYGLTFFEYLARNEEKAKIYNKAMERYGKDQHELLELHDFSKSKTIVDVGGGNGHLLMKIMKRDRSIKKGILFDLPEIIRYSKTSNLNDENITKIDYIGGNFFDEIPVNADTILLSRVLHDWDDENAIKILRNVKDALQEDGKVLIFEIITPENTQFDIGTSLNFNLLAMLGGKERALKEFERIFEAAGFKITKVLTLRSIISMIVVEKERS